MIFYFSGTGNSKWAALSLADQLKEEVWDITDILNAKEKMPKRKENENIGFVFPIYAWQVPEHVMQFIKQIDMKEDNFSYAVCTCGEDTGNAMKVLQKEAGIKSVYSLVMPSNYIITSDVESPQEEERKKEEAKKQISRIANEVSEKKIVSRVNTGIFAFGKTSIIGTMFRKFARTTKPFVAEDVCTGCGLCANNCPSNSIEMEDGKPKWVHTSCYQCLACINRCPKSAIQYGKGTKKHGRYYYTDKK